jgi:hypothetical protein
MKNSAKKIFIYGSIFIAGAIIGATIFFYSSRDLPAQLMINTMLNNATSNASSNTRVLSFLRHSEIENAIELLENDLDTNIITLNALRHDYDFISIEDRNKIVKKLKFLKKYRLDYPMTNKNKEIGKKVEDALSDISIE